MIRVKAVPGASRSEIVGVLGDRLKVRVAAAPEGGKANAAVRALLAGALGVGESGVTLASGASRAEKSFAVSGVDVARARTALSGAGAARVSAGGRREGGAGGAGGMGGS